MLCLCVFPRRRYARTDELGIPFGITVDFDTIKDEGLIDTVTLRDRDTTEQLRIPTAEVAHVVFALCNGTTKWVEVAAKYPKQAAPKGEVDKE
jgi:glycyl-tRNA synthetase